MTGQPTSFAEGNYQAFADRYAAIVPTKSHNAYLVDPAMKDLLPPLAGLRVLDAGSGPGFKARDMLAEGAASVTALDATPRFVELTREALGGAVGAAAHVLQHDLNTPLTFAADSSFDLVHSNLVLNYLADWRPVMREFYRVLAPGGWLVFSDTHPAGDLLLIVRGKAEVPGGLDYFATQAFPFVWTGFGEPNPTIWSYRRSFAELINPVIEAGFLLDRLVETKPTEKFFEVDAERGARYMRQPTFVCIRARKPV